MVNKANKMYGLNIKYPKELDFTDEELKNDILNIKPHFISKTVKPTVHKPAADTNNPLVPATLMKNLLEKTTPIESLPSQLQEKRIMPKNLTRRRNNTTIIYRAFNT
jgi:hypothetical protein